MSTTAPSSEGTTHCPNCSQPMQFRWHLDDVRTPARYECDGCGHRERP